MDLTLVGPNGVDVVEYPKEPRYRPKRGSVIVRKIERERSPGGIHLPSQLEESLVEGTVVLVGEPRIHDGVTLPMDVKVGDVILYSEPAGLVIDPFDRSLVMLHEENALAVRMERE